MSAATEAASPIATPKADLQFVWLEITGICQLQCVHCYAESGPAGTHGAMTTDNWRRVIDECVTLGVGMVQFIGGEPTLHPDLPALIEHALAGELEVEVFSNLVHVTNQMWDTFTRPGVRLACSYYSDDPGQHAFITRRPSHGRTRANIIEALERSIPLRVGVIGMADDQRTDAAIAELEALGVAEVGYDHLRQVGRGVRDQQATMDQLCGKCADGVLAVSPTGDVWPCVFTRWMPVGNVLEQALADVLSAKATSEVRAALTEHFAYREHAEWCKPDGGSCRPNCQPCGPNCQPACNPACNPCQPGCRPGCHPSCNPACQPNCQPACSPSCGPVNCRPVCWPSR